MEPRSPGASVSRTSGGSWGTEENESSGARASRCLHPVSVCLAVVNSEAWEGQVWVAFVVPPSKQVFKRALRVREHGEAEWELMGLFRSSHFRETGREETP